MSIRPGTAEIGQDPARDTATPSQPVVRALRPPARAIEPGPVTVPPPAPDLVAVLEAVRPALDEPGAAASALALTSTLAFHLGIDRVSVGVCETGPVHLLAVSDAPDRSPRSPFSAAMQAAMDEAASHGHALLHEDRSGDLEAHGRLADCGGARRIYSVPLRHQGEVCGVVVYESLTDKAVEPATLRACDALGGVLGPALELKRREQRWNAGRWLAQRRNMAVVLILLAVTAALSLVQIDYRVTAPARVEGSVQRTVVAPFDGYVETASVRAGERVVAGQELATLQQSSLLLERSSVAAERDDLAKQYRRALASRDRAEGLVLEARTAQAQAKLDLLDVRIARTRITAPFDGVVLSGDLSRSLGAPVQRGDVLFQVAPGQGYRVVLQADERDVADLAPRMTGTLSLAALPDAEFDISLEHVSGAARTEAGQAVFLVESRIEGDSAALRPGMEGVAKVSVESRSLVWVLTHRLVEWLQLTLWSVLP